MPVAVAVEAHRGALRKRTCKLLIQNVIAGIIEVFERAERFSHIATASAGNGKKSIVVAALFATAFGIAYPERTPERGKHILLCHGLKLENAGTRKQRGIKRKEGVFSRGAYKRDPAVLHIFQQRLLLFFIEILYFVDIKDYSVVRRDGM